MKNITIDTSETMKKLLAQEDTDGDHKITIQDQGPKRFWIESDNGDRFEVVGTYYLSTLLQELALGLENGKKTLRLNGRKIFENPVDRLSRMIREYFWDGLTRRIDAKGLSRLVNDEKAGEHDAPRIYVPFSDTRAQKYFERLAYQNIVPDLQVIRLPRNITPEYVRSINLQPGLLSLALEEFDGELRGKPFVVPGGRFNEMYGWDSYFESLGLLIDGRVDLAKAMVDNFVYEINHYGQVLNANRTYYLTRSQPPFLTSMALAVFDHLSRTPESKKWLANVFRTAIQEYHTVWMNRERLTETGLSRYYAYGLGITPETEPGHYDTLLRPYAKRAGCEVHEYARKMIAGEIDEPELQEYFLHDRAVRESGHDTSYRIENRCAHLNTVDLNSLLYKYEIDIAEIISHHFDEALSMPDGSVERSDAWRQRAEKRRELVNQLLWNDERGMYFDYHFVEKQQTGFESATMLYPLWAKLTSPAQAESLVKNALPLLEASGGIVSTTKKSRGKISATRPAKQWDYPNGWAPHQMLIWQGLINYGYKNEAQRLAYRWVDMITRNAADYNGTIPEKYDVVRRSHQVFMEYGNVGTEFDYITREGFGWMNASYQVGLKLLSRGQSQSLKKLIPSEWLFGSAPVK